MVQLTRRILVLLCCFTAVVGCRARDEDSFSRGASQALALSVSIDQVASKAPVMGVTFGDGQHNFWLLVTKEDGVTPYETGAGGGDLSEGSFFVGKSTTSGASQSWSYFQFLLDQYGEWQEFAIAALPRLYAEEPMLVAGFYPYGGEPEIKEGRDGGRANLYFTTRGNPDQTDMMYSGEHTLTYDGAVTSQSVALSFRHVSALLEFRVRLKSDVVPTQIYNVEICNKAGKSFLSSSGFYSPYTGEVTESSVGNVLITRSQGTELSTTQDAVIRVMVPPTLLEGYQDGDIYVRLCLGVNNSDAKMFPILREYLSSGTYGFERSGRYVYKLLCDRTANGAMTVVGWQSSTPGTAAIGGGDISGILPLAGWGNMSLGNEALGSDAYVEVDGLRWASGNLVASGSYGCKIGTSTDAGLYFHRGGLVGWSGGANGDGVGTGSPELAIQVQPIGYNGSGAWPAGSYAGGDAGTGYGLPATDNAVTGVGDPCRYYLGADWRTPTADEYVCLLGFDGKNAKKNTPLKLNSYDLFFSAPGFRGSGGVLGSKDIKGFYWSSSNEGSSLNFSNIFLGMLNDYESSYGFPVRCVSGTYVSQSTIANPPTANDYVTIDGLKWATGNLVAMGSSGCTVGAPTDYGLYFHFGGLVGWSGGANGDGMGTSTGESALAVQVQPIGYKGSLAWPAGSYAGGDVGQGSCLPATDNSVTGIGDPCRYYLGDPWRTPTADEYRVLFDGVTAQTAWTSVTGWDWQATPPGALSTSSLFFPASGSRSHLDGSFYNVTTSGYGWSSSVYSATSGYTLLFNQSSGVIPQGSYNRSLGFPVRCVSGTYVPTPTVANPPTASDYVTIDGLKWAKGNLVAVDRFNAKVGASTDCGLYFHFGSLVGWSGGANGSGVGTGELAPTVGVRPTGYTGRFAWPAGYYTGGTAGTGYGLPATDVAATGVGDPCRVYLGADWRTPTAAEYYVLFDGVTAQTAWTSVTGWDWQATPPGALSTSSLFFPASGLRNYSGGPLGSVATRGSYWSSSVYSATNGYYLHFTQSNGVAPQNDDKRSHGFPVRCVSGTQVSPTVPNPPKASDYVTIDGLKWAKGNLVAVDRFNAKVGASTDCGLYFHFGSLVGWSGGANGSGVGTGEPDLAIQVKPNEYTGSTWPAGSYAGGDAGTGYGLPATDVAATGVGDPCRLYLGAPWRTPTAAEWLALIGTDGANTNKAMPLKVNSYDLFFPASGGRGHSNGSFYGVAGDGYGWSSSVQSAWSGFYLGLTGSRVSPQDYGSRSTGFPVRCVSSVQ